MRRYATLLAFAIAGCKMTSEETTGTVPPSLPPAPTSLTAVDGDGSVKLTWTPSGSAKSFRVLRASAVDGSYALRGTTEASSFVDSASNGNVFYYKVQAVSDAGEGTATIPVRAVPYPVCVTTDDNRVVVLRQGHDRERPLREFGDLAGIPFFGGLGVDAVSGEILVGPVSLGAPNGVRTFERAASGNVVPKRRLFAAHSAFALDALARRLLLVPPGQDAIEIYDASADGDSRPLHTVRGAATGLAGTRTLVVDHAHGEVVALTLDPREVANPAASLNTYSLAGVEGEAASEDLPPLRFITGPGSSLQFATGAVAVDELHGEIAVLEQPDPASTNIAIFDRSDQGNAVVPKRQIVVQGLFQNGAVAFDTAHDEIWVSGLFSDPGPNSFVARLAVFSRTAAAGDPPLREVSGPSTGLRFASGLAFDETAGEVLVLDFGSLLAFDRAASGDAPPKRIVSGASAGLRNPTAIAADPVHGELIVANALGPISAYPRPSTGAVTPVRSFGTGIPADQLHYDPGADEVYVPSLDGLVHVFPRTASGTPATASRTLPSRVQQSFGITGAGSEITLAGPVLGLGTLTTLDGRTGSLLRTITSSNLFSFIPSVARDPRRDELVAVWPGPDFTSGAVRIFNRSDSGEIAAKRVIASGSFVPLGPVAVNDATGEIWVVGFSGVDPARQQIAIFAPTAGLGAEPSRTIDTAAIGIPSIRGMTFCP